MPYIVTTKRPMPDAPPTFIGNWFASRRAVATLEETPGAVMDAIHELPAWRSEARMRWAQMDPVETGFTVGPFPDGSAIEVEPVHIAQLKTAAGFDPKAGIVPWAEIIERWNAVEAGHAV